MNSFNTGIFQICKRLHLWCAPAVTGAIAAAAVGCATLGSSLRCGTTLFAFFFASSKLTRYAEEEKDNDEAFKVGGQRNWQQVIATFN